MYLIQQRKGLLSKTLTILLAGLLCISISGCSSDKTSVSSTVQTSNRSSKAENANNSFQNIQVSPEVHYVFDSGKEIESEQQFINLAYYYKSNGATEFSALLSEKLFTEDEIYRLSVLGSIDSCEISSNSDTKEVSFQNIVWSDLQIFNCETKADISAATKFITENGINQCTIVIASRIYDLFLATNTGNLDSLIADGFSYSRAEFNNYARSVTLYGIKESVESLTLDTIDAVVGYMREQVVQGNSQYVMNCSPEVAAKLISYVDKYNSKGIQEVMCICGVMSGSHWEYSESTHSFNFSMKYSGGQNILRAWYNNDFSELTERELQTYKVAEKLAEELKRSTEVDTVYAIHDRLCSMSSYCIDTNSDEDDQAIGALLNGKANCDGYSDAFYLIGTMAGLEIRIQHGITVTYQDTGSADDTHIWNLVKINGQWYNIDVTWDDEDDNYSPLYTYCLIGTDRISKTHYRPAGFNVEVACNTNSSMRPDYEYVVNNDSEFESACKSAANANYKKIIFILSDDLVDKKDDAFNYLRKYRNYGNLNWYFEPDMNTLTVFVG